MQAGDLNRRITLLKYSYEVGEAGAPIETWTPYATVWASREDISDSEKLAGYGPVSTLFTRFVVHHSAASAAFTVDDRVRQDGRDWDITGIKEAKNTNGRFLEISTKVRLS